MLDIYAPPFPLELETFTFDIDGKDQEKDSILHKAAKEPLDCNREMEVFIFGDEVKRKIENLMFIEEINQSDLCVLKPGCLSFKFLDQENGEESQKKVIYAFTPRNYFHVENIMQIEKIPFQFLEFHVDDSIDKNGIKEYDDFLMEFDEDMRKKHGTFSYDFICLKNEEVISVKSDPMLEEYNLQKLQSSVACIENGLSCDQKEEILVFNILSHFLMKLVNP